MGCANRKLARKTPDVSSTLVKSSTSDKSTTKKRRERSLFRALLLKRKDKTESCTTSPSTGGPETPTDVVVASSPLNINTPESVDDGDVTAPEQTTSVLESSSHESIDDVEQGQPVLTKGVEYAVQEQLLPEKQELTKNSDITKPNVQELLLSKEQGQIILMENSDSIELSAQEHLFPRGQDQNVLTKNSDIVEPNVEEIPLHEKQDKMALKSTDRSSIDVDVHKQSLTEGRDQTVLMKISDSLDVEAKSLPKLPESLTGFETVSNSNDESKVETKCAQLSHNIPHANDPNSSVNGGSLKHINQLSFPLVQVDNRSLAESASDVESKFHVEGTRGNADPRFGAPSEQSDQQLLHSALHINQHNAATSQLFQPCKPKQNSGPYENCNYGQASAVAIQENEHVHQPMARKTYQSIVDNHKTEYVHQPMARKTYQRKVRFQEKEYIHRPMVPKRKVELREPHSLSRQRHYKRLILHYWLERCSLINEIDFLTTRVQQYERELRLFVALQNLRPCRATILARSLIRQRQKRFTRKQHKLYEKKRELATTEAKLDYFCLKYSPDLKYTRLYTSREMHYLSPIPEEINTNMNERLW